MNSVVSDSDASASPCINVCVLNSEDICLGCYRTLDEIGHWGALDEQQKAVIVERAKQRGKKITAS